MKISSPTNDYVLYEKILGRGSYGVVLYGKQVSTLKSYAIKIVIIRYLFIRIEN